MTSKQREALESIANFPTESAEAMGWMVAFISLRRLAKLALLVEKPDSGNLANDLLYNALDALYERGWRDGTAARKPDSRGTNEWQALLDLFPGDYQYQIYRDQSGTWSYATKEAYQAWPDFKRVICVMEDNFDPDTALYERGWRGNVP